MSEERETWEPMRLHFYSKPGDKFPRTWAHADRSSASEFRPECVIVEKVFNECSVVECPVVVRFTDIPSGAGNVSDCVVLASRVVGGRIVEDDVVEFTVEWIQRITFDSSHAVETFRFTKRVNLEGADPDLFGPSNLDFIPFVQCLNCHIVETSTGNQVECEVGIFVVVKLMAFVQLEIERARFCPMPPECEQVSPIGCPDFFTMVERGDLWPPFPPQPERPRERHEHH